MIKAYCSIGDHYPEEVIATIPREFDDDRICVIVNGDGTATNRWADGTVGLNPEQKEYAEADESPICPDHHCEIEWISANIFIEKKYDNSTELLPVSKDSKLS